MTTKQTHLNPTRSVEDRVQHLMRQMTLDEKVAQLRGVWGTDLINQERQFVAEKAASQLANGVGHLTRIGATSLLPPVESAGLANDIQHYLVEHTRLGIPAIVHEESCAGYMAWGATTFPQAIGLAATWQPELIEQMADVIRQQMRAVGAHHALAPVLDVVRDPRWGRLEETFGEDPFLITSIGSAYINGIQGVDWHQGIVATAKHFIGYGWSEGGLNWAPAHIPERELREMFLRPFIAAIQEAHVGSVMNAYQELDGVPLGSSRELMVDLLRGELGFDSVVVSDYFTLNQLVDYHHVAADKQEAARLGLEAGIDVELPTPNCYAQPLLDGLASGAIDMALVDDSVRRILTMKFELGLFEHPYVDIGKVAAVYNTDEQLELSRALARQSIVLLKNENDLLPLNRLTTSIAVIGPAADTIRMLQGDYHFPSHLEGIFDPNISAESPNQLREAPDIDWIRYFPPSTTVLQAVSDQVSPDTQVYYAQGCDVLGDDTSGFDEAVKLAGWADVAIVVVGDKSGLSLGSSSGESIDRAGLDLPGVQQALVEAVYHTGTPTVVVLLSGRPYAISWIDEHIPAVLEAWLPAQQGGLAIADVLLGAVSPGGKLPVSVPRAVGQIPVYYNHKPSGGRTHWQGEYIDMSTKPLYPFGHGLSYTHFAYSDLHISSTHVAAHDSVTIAATITNTGQRLGDEVVQLYLYDPVASVTRPVKELKGFKRLTLQPGQQKTVTFAVDVRHLAFYDRAMNFVVEPGQIDVMIGSSSEDIRLCGHFEITGETTIVQPVFATPVDVSS